MADPTTGIALVTGANRGIGLEMVHQLAPNARRVIATCRRPGAADELHALADEHPDTIDIRALDVSDPEQIDRLHSDVAESYDALHLLLNNAGVNGGGTSDTFDSVDMETLVHTFRVNSAGPHLMAKAFAPLLTDGAQESESVIINITSQLGSIENTKGRATWQSYRASKAALNMLSRLQANHFEGSGIIVVAIHPGWVQTDMGGPNAAITPQTSVRGILDVARSVSPDDAGRFLTYDGSTLPW